MIANDDDFDLGVDGRTTRDGLAGEFGQVLSEAESKQVQLVNDGPVMFLVVARGGALARET